MKKSRFVLLIGLFCVGFLASSCWETTQQRATKNAITATEIASALTMTPTRTSTPTLTATLTLDPTATITETVQPSATKRPTWTPLVTEIPCMPGWERYQVRTMEQIVAYHFENAYFRDLPANGIYIELGSEDEYQYPSRVVVTYGADFREIDPLKKMVISGIIRNYMPNLSKEQQEAMYQEEVLFIEGNTEYWIPVQHELVEYMLAELGEGDTIMIYITYLGATNIEGEIELVFSVNGYHQ